jgi:V8-like Glu-specific endopeptidase
VAQPNASTPAVHAQTINTLEQQQAGQIAAAPSPATEHVAPQSILDDVARQTPDQRGAMAASLQQQIDALQKQLAQKLAVQPRTPALVTEIAALNAALTSKRQAYLVARGESSTLSRAAAESYAANSNPLFLMCGEQYWAPKDPLKWLDQVKKVGNQLTTIGRSIGMLMAGGKPTGTGVIIGPNEVLTNLHVLQQMATLDTSTNTWTFESDALIEFDREYPLGAPNGCAVPNALKIAYVNGVFAIPTPPNNDDLAILLVSNDGTLPPALQFALRPASAYKGQMIVAVIGYPGPPDDMTIAEQIDFFQAPGAANVPQFEYKRLSEGYTGSEEVTPDGVFVHKANTAGGNSGSPVIDLADASLVGLHFKGQNRFQNQLGYNFAITSDRIVSLMKAAGLQ